MRAASIVVLIAIALPFLLGQFWAYQLGLYALYAAAAVGVGLCWGQAGFLPLGQALFFGLAAYLSGLAFIAFRGQSDPCRSRVAACRADFRTIGLRDRLCGVSALRRERRLFLDDHAGAGVARVPDRDELEFGHRRIQRAQGDSGPSRAWTISPTSIMSPPRPCWPCWRSPAGFTPRRSASCGGRWRRTNAACSFSASIPTCSRPWRSAPPVSWPASAARSMRRNRASSRRRSSDLASPPIW